MSRGGLQPYIAINTKRNTETTKMTTTNLIKSLAIAALFVSVTAHAADSNIVIALENGKQTASFKVGDSSCVLKDDQIRCTPVGK